MGNSSSTYVPNGTGNAGTPLDGSPQSACSAGTKARRSDSVASSDTPPTSQGLSKECPSTKTDSGYGGSDILDEYASYRLLRAPTAFRDMVLDKHHDNIRLSWILDGHNIQPNQIPVMYREGKIYSLLATSFALTHERPVGDETVPVGNCRQIEFESCNSIKKFVPLGAEEPHSFVILGYLTEPCDGIPSGGHITNYVWALDVTTEPKSLWLIYNYLTSDDVGNDATLRLSEVYEHEYNACCDCKHTHTRVNGFLGLGEWDVVQVIDDVGSWLPSNPVEARFGKPYKLGPSLRAYFNRDEERGLISAA